METVDDYIQARPMNGDAWATPYGSKYFEDAYKSGIAGLESGGYKKTRGVPYTAVGDNMISKLSSQFQQTLSNLASGQGMNDIIPRSGGDATGFSGYITPRESIEPYYGGSTQSELDKAHYYSNYMKGYTGINSPYTQAYGKIDAPVKVLVQNDPSAQYPYVYNPSKNYVLSESVGFDLDNPRTLQELNEGKNNAIDQVKYNKQTPSEIEFAVKNPWSDFYSSVEHEIGHSWTAGDKNAPTIRGYMGDKPDEMANALGRIQRETYSQYGKRFDSKGFADYLNTQMGLDEGKMFEGYSNEAKRGLRTIMDSYKKDYDVKGTFGNPKKNPDVLWKQAVYAIPGFVEARKKSDEVAG
jgi:hypothetical protein